MAYDNRFDEVVTVRMHGLPVRDDLDGRADLFLASR